MYFKYSISKTFYVKIFVKFKYKGSFVYKTIYECLLPIYLFVQSNKIRICYINFFLKKTISVISYYKLNTFKIFRR